MRMLTGAILILGACVLGAGAVVADSLSYGRGGITWGLAILVGAFGIVIMVSANAAGKTNTDAHSDSGDIGNTSTK